MKYEKHFRRGCTQINVSLEEYLMMERAALEIELLSKSTRNYDKRKEFTLYRDIDSLKEYILVDTEKIYVEKHIRDTDNSWQLTEYNL